MNKLCRKRNINRPRRKHISKEMITVWMVMIILVHSIYIYRLNYFWLWYSDSKKMRHQDIYISVAWPSYSPLARNCDCEFKCENFKQNSGIDSLSIQVSFTLEWIPEDLINGESILFGLAALSDYLSQCWPRSPTLYGAMRPEWVKNGMGSFLGYTVGRPISIPHYCDVT